jgi:hypothetical protein
MPKKIRRELPSGWIVTYKLGRDSTGATVITGLSVDSGSGEPVPVGGLTAPALRQIPMGVRTITRTYADVNAEFDSWNAVRNSGRTYAELRERALIVRDASPRRGRRHDEWFLLTVAQAWDHAYWSGARDLYAEVRAQLHRQGYDYTRSGIRELINKARDRGLLELPSKGSPGGGLTDHARKLLAEL